MIVQSLKKRKNNTVEVTVDGEVYKLNVNICIDNSIYENAEISEQTLDYVIERSNEEAAFESALNVLEIRIHSVYEIKTKLRRHGYKNPAIDYAVNKLIDLNLLDDREFATAYCDELINQKKYGRYRVIEQLKKRGICRDLANEVYDEFDCDAGEFIDYHISKKFGEITDKKTLNNAYSYLIRLGFESSDINNALNSSNISFQED